MLKASPTLCMVIPYFGNWPFWMPFFLESCRRNETIDWLIYTDCGIPPSCPANVKIVETTFTLYCQIISERLDIKFSPTNAYKLCDIKPALGYIHAEELQGYDFMAFGDIDLIYGNLRAYFTPERLAVKDLFSTHQRRISGHLCIVRNTEEMRSAFMRAKNWRGIVMADEHMAFDEKAFSKVFLRHKNSPKWVKNLASIIDPWLQRGEFMEAYSTPNARITWVDNTRNYPQRWIWQQGYLSNDINIGREFPYFHFLVWKKQWRVEIGMDDHLRADESWKNKFEISSAGFSY